MGICCFVCLPLLPLGSHFFLVPCGSPVKFSLPPYPHLQGWAHDPCLANHITSYPPATAKHVTEESVSIIGTPRSSLLLAVLSEDNISLGYKWRFLQLCAGSPLQWEKRPALLPPSAPRKAEVKKPRERSRVPVTSMDPRV